MSFHLAAIFKEERVKRDLSRRSLAKISGISRQAIGYVEREKQSPSFETMLDITEAMGVPLEIIVAQARERASKKLRRRKSGRVTE
jgi:transcriptional regulator with XRE-family HTH domain